MDIVILGAAMPFGPNTLKFKSLGGSETAQLMLGKELAKQGHRVLQLTNLPAPGEPDFIPPGSMGEDGVRYIPIEAWQGLVCSTPHDLLIISRDMRHAGVPHQAKHAVFWAHDLATHTFMAPALQSLSFNIDEIWAVSNWHADQIHSVTGYPRERIIAMRNGIVDVRDDTVVTPTFGTPERKDKTLIFAARPERGLEALVREGGIMERLPEFKLRVSMYAHFPEHMKPMYDYCRARIEALPNVEYLGSLSQSQMRAAIAESSAYVYPTMFEETSCILARECIETFTPMLTNQVGALPETLGDCGFFLEDFRIEQFENRYTKPSLGWNTDEYCEAFANMVRWWHTDRAEVYRNKLSDAQIQRHEDNDLYWGGVAQAAAARVGAYETSSIFSRAWSLVRDGDVIPAIALLRANEGELRGASLHLLDQLLHEYAFVESDEALAKHYAMCHDKLAAEDQHFHSDMTTVVPQSPRWQAVAAQLARLPEGARVLDFGCAEGVQVIAWAKVFPKLQFVGVDFADMALANAEKHAMNNGVGCQVQFRHAAHEEDFFDEANPFDAIICTEVLEHQPEPWTLLQKVERYCKPGGRVILTTPFGEWETDQWEQFNRMWNRQHIWQVDAYAYDVMLVNKQGVDTALVPGNVMPDGRARGHLCVSYTADQTPIPALDPLAKAAKHHPRETCAATLIAKDASKTIRNTLESIKSSVQMVRVVVDEATKDRTAQVIIEFAADNPWLYVEVIRGPAIKNREWGFDDARNLSIETIETDWFFWIDTDEYLSSSIKKFLRSNALDSYGIHQHHFSVEPRGVPAQIDRPSRLCRSKMRFFGKVHEHAETGYNEGPGYAILIPDADIGHVGYVNEPIRRARFERNFPFLEWDRELNPDRKLGTYLWFRDILHRLRYAQEQQNGPMIFALANEAVQFYNTHGEQIVSFGMGAEAALSYLSEAYRVLGRGRQVDVLIALDGQQVKFGGIVEDVSQVLTPIRKLLDGELEKARGKYWR